MTERYFAVDRQLVPNISVDGSVVWNQDDISTLEDTINDGYVTAEEDTQYLSVLDSTNEMSLENLNITLTNPKLEVEETETFVTEELIEQPVEENNEQQVVVYSVEGSDELFGIQVVEDEEGNLQKYQFQLRKTADGQLEAMPETIQLLPMEEEVQEEQVADPVEDIPDELIINQHHSMHIFVQEDNSGEHILPDHNTIQEEEGAGTENTLLYENESIEDDTVDIKPGILALQNVKQEIQEHQPEFSPPPPAEAEEDTAASFPETLEEENIGFDPIPEPETHLIEYDQQNEHQRQHPETNENFEHVEVSPDMDNRTVEPQETDENNMADSDVDDYHIVEGVHITGDVENNTETVTETVEKPATSTVNNTNILRHASKNNKETKSKKDNKLYLYVVQHPEKENVESLSLCPRPVKANPRSILKSSHAMIHSKNENEVHDERLSKRFSRCKEAMQARIFHNFINKTTIPQAPIRKDRLPRKQKIKPVERMDEEIVVQEVMVSSNGFVEAIGAATNKENHLEVTEYVELTDSDDDYDPKRVNKKKKKHKKKKIEITISDDSDVSSVIELDESDAEDEAKNKEQEVPTSPAKRRRGRPPKTTSESPLKKLRSDSEAKPEIPCPKCEKSFPSQNSLKTHLQHHNLQSSLRNQLPTKYKCEDCGASYRNSLVLKRHVCLKFTCQICSRKFGDSASANAHKRTHVKEQLVKSTTGALVSPKKSKDATFKSPKKVNSLKCKTCGKVCSSLLNLNVHVKTHKEYSCATCSAKFVSQFMLEKHLREKCVKSPKGFRRSLRLSSSSSSSNDESKRASRTSCSKFSCDKCAMKFQTFKGLFEHKVAKHGVGASPGVFSQTGKRERGVYGGVPTTNKMKKAYAELKRRLESTD